jgi:hypothetical protein
VNFIILLKKIYLKEFPNPYFHDKNTSFRRKLLTHQLSDFAKEWVENSSATEDSVRESYKLLKKIGLKDDKIASQAHLLGRDPETIERNYESLQKLGLKDDKIASQAHLLGMNPETIERNYRHHVGLLRQNYENRGSGRELLTSQAQLLGIKPETIAANVQFLNSLGINYNNAFLLGTRSQSKREKLAWLLREVFNYRNVPEENKKDVIFAARKYVRENPQRLIDSIKTLDRKKERIREKARDYFPDI